MGSLGDSIAGIEREPILPSSRNAAVQTAATGAATPTAKPAPAADTKTADPSAVETWKGLLKDPRFKAGLMQFGVNMIAGQGFGRSAGGGMAAVGRTVETRKADEEAARQAELEASELAMKQAESQARIGSLNRSNRGGGGGGGGSTSAAKNDLDQKYWLKTMTDTGMLSGVNELTGEPTPGLAPEEAISLSSTLANLSAAGMDAGKFLVAYKKDPTAAMNGYNQIFNPGAVSTPAPSAADTASKQSPEVTTGSTIKSDEKPKKWVSVEEEAKALISTPEEKAADTADSQAGAIASTLATQFAPDDEGAWVSFIINLKPTEATLEALKRKHPEFSAAVEKAKKKLKGSK